MTRASVFHTARALPAAKDGLVIVDSGATSSIGGCADLEIIVDVMRHQTSLQPKIDQNERVKHRFGNGRSQLCVSRAFLATVSTVQQASTLLAFEAPVTSRRHSGGHLVMLAGGDMLQGAGGHRFPLVARSNKRRKARPAPRGSHPVFTRSLRPRCDVSTARTPQPRRPRPQHQVRSGRDAPHPRVPRTERRRDAVGERICQARRWHHQSPLHAAAGALPRSTALCSTRIDTAPSGAARLTLGRPGGHPCAHRLRQTVLGAVDPVSFMYILCELTYPHDVLLFAPRVSACLFRRMRRATFGSAVHFTRLAPGRVGGLVLRPGIFRPLRRGTNTVSHTGTQPAPRSETKTHHMIRSRAPELVASRHDTPSSMRTRILLHRPMWNRKCCLANCRYCKTAPCGTRAALATNAEPEQNQFSASAAPV